MSDGASSPVAHEALSASAPIAPAAPHQSGGRHVLASKPTATPRAVRAPRPSAGALDAALAHVRRLQHRGETFMWLHVANQYGVPINTLRRHADPAFRARHNENNRMNRNRSQLIGRKHNIVRDGMHRVSKQDVAERLREIPPDTRSLTQRMFGDPLPGRSALDREHRT